MKFEIMYTNHRFAVFSGPSLIGWSELECGDAPMGVAFGRFFPTPEYSSVQPLVVAAAGGPLPDELRLSIRARSGDLLQSTGGVHLVDYSADAGAEGLEVSILGVSSPAYDTVFPEHVTAYESL